MLKLNSIFINIYISFKCKEPIKYISLLVGIIVLLSSILFIPEKIVKLKFLDNSEEVVEVFNEVYLHHWYYGLLFSLLYRYKNEFSQFMNGYMIGLLISGISIYGDDNNLIKIIKETNPTELTKPTSII